MARLTFAGNDTANRHAFHDVGAASENLLLQATTLGLFGHQMAGFVLWRRFASPFMPRKGTSR